MCRKIRYGFRLLWNCIRIPILWLFSLGRIQIPLTQLFSPKSELRTSEHGTIVVKSSLNMEKGALVCTTGGTITIDSAYLNRNSMIVSRGKVLIGKGVTIGPNVCIYDHNHNTTPTAREQPFITGEVVIGDDVWVGANAVILMGVHIGNNAVVGAGAVVTKDIPAGAVAIGVPARCKV